MRGVTVFPLKSESDYKYFYNQWIDRTAWIDKNFPVLSVLCVLYDSDMYDVVTWFHLLSVTLIYCQNFYL